MTRTFSFILLVGVTILLLGCGSSGIAEEVKGGDRIEPPVASGSTSDTAHSGNSRTPANAVAPQSQAPVAYDGPASLEERILASPVIARVQLDSVSSTTELGTTYQGMKYLALLEFSLSVQEYLKGSGADNIVAVWAAAPLFDTAEEAQDALPAIVNARNPQWDDHEAIVFLQTSEASLPTTQQANRYYLAWGGSRPMYSPDDGYSIASIHEKLWLPTVAAVGATSQSTGDRQQFLTDVPPATGTAPTITLGEIKARIAAVTAKLNADDGSEEYTECVQRTYRYEKINRHRNQTEGKGYFRRIPDQQVGSGIAASSVVHEDLDYGDLPNTRAETWFDGGDANLFSVELGDAVPWDSSGDGENDAIQYARRVVVERPLPAGIYELYFNHRAYYFVLCQGYSSRYEWTVKVNAPGGTLHEAFFDPETIGEAVGADDTNGVLKPASFTDANDASATLQRIAWEPGTGDSGTVKVEVNPNNVLTGQLLDFIELDGTVSLSLNAADATLDSMNDSLNWAVESQPWHDGDLLMVRIRRAPSSSTT